MDGNIRQVVLKANVLACLGGLSMNSDSDDDVHGKENGNRTNFALGWTTGQPIATATKHTQYTGEEIIFKIAR
jgi:hypothetical protein